MMKKMKNMIIIRKNCSYKIFLNFSLNVGVFKTAFVYRHLVTVYGIQFQPETIDYLHYYISNHAISTNT